MFVSPFRLYVRLLFKMKMDRVLEGDEESILSLRFKLPLGLAKYHIRGQIHSAVETLLLCISLYMTYINSV